MQAILIKHSGSLQKKKKWTHLLEDLLEKGGSGREGEEWGGVIGVFKKIKIALHTIVKDF